MKPAKFIKENYSDCFNPEIEGGGSYELSKTEFAQALSNFTKELRKENKQLLKTLEIHRPFISLGIEVFNAINIKKL